MNKDDLKRAEEMDLIHFSQDFEKEVSGNKAKYLSYKEANARISAAILKGFYLEAITIEESILCDRLQSYYAYLLNLNADEFKAHPFFQDYTTLGKLIHKNNLKKKLNLTFNKEVSEVFIKLRAWWGKRNETLHSLAKSTPTTPTMDYKEFLKLAKKTALDGVKLIDEIKKVFKNNPKDK